MLKKKKIIPNDKPIFREVIPQALKFTWAHPSHWILGVFAAVLFSGSALDIFLKFWNTIQYQGNEIFIGNVINNLWQVAILSSATVPWIGYIKGILAIIFFLVILTAIFGFSCVSQGALVHSIGSDKNKKKVSIKSALTLGSKAIVPIAILNLILIIFIWVARFGASFPLALVLDNDNIVYIVIYIISFIIFSILTFGLSILQIYSLNAIILHNASLVEALTKGWKIMREHWLVTVETIIVQSLIIITLALIATSVALMLTFPAIILFVISYININISMFYASLILFFIITLAFTLFTTGFIVTFQYATWTIMFHKFKEGAIPKIYRLFRSFFKS